jgi:hypothetical protein
LLIGALLVIGSGIGALSMAASLSARIDVVVADRNILEGEVIAEDDLRVAAVGLTGDVQAIDPADIPEVVGKVAAGPIGEGAVLHPTSLIGAGDNLQKTFIVGVDVDPGEYPRVGMRPGDQMILIATGEENFGDFDTEAREVGEAEVVEVAKLAGADSYLVSLRVDAGLGPTVASLASDDRLSLALKELADTDLGVSPVSPLDPVDPLENADPKSPESELEVAPPEAEGGRP